MQFNETKMKYVINVVEPVVKTHKTVLIILELKLGVLENL